MRRYTKEIMSQLVGRLNMFYEVTGRRVYPNKNNGAAYCANKHGITYGYPHAYACTANYAVGRCRLTVTKRVLKAPVVSALETIIT